MKDLHWSISPSRPDEFDYVSDMRKTLTLLSERCASASSPTPSSLIRSRYRILPRMRMTFGWGQLPQDAAAIGAAEIARLRANGGWIYDVRTSCVPTGENAVLQYETDDSPLRALRGEWSYSATYDTPDAFKDYHAQGQITSGGDIRLRLRGGLEFSAGRVEPGAPLVAYWTLLDTLRVSADAGAGAGVVALLEHLECLKPACRVVHFDEWLCELGPAPMRLEGYCLSGVGVEPQYWWFDDSDRAIFIGTTNYLYILEEWGREEGRALASVETRNEKPAPSAAAPRPVVHPQTSRPGSTRGKPNILFINTDQQTWDAISALGNRFVRTPALDRLMANGIRFARSYCTDPVCCPARSSWASGLYTSETGCLYNGGRMHEDVLDVGQMLRGAGGAEAKDGGYLALHAGKWHVDGRDPRGSFETLYYGRSHIGACAGELYDPITVRAAMDFLDGHDGRRPFYLQIGIINPHDICEFEHSHEHNRIPDPVDAGLVAPDELPPLPPNLHVNFKELALQEAFHRAGKDSLVHGSIREGTRHWTDNHWRWLAWNLYRCVERADQDIGLVLNALEASPYRDSTLILFSVDHGEAAGRHNLFQKFSLYEEAIRTPLVASEFGESFGISKGAVDEEHMISGVDLLPTILDYADVAVPSGARLQGRSLRPLIEGRAVRDWPRYAYVESNVWGRALVTRRIKYIMEFRPHGDEAACGAGAYVPPRTATHEIGRELLFDLENDPWETIDISCAHPDQIEQMRALLRSHEQRLASRPVEERSRGVMDQWRRALLARAHA